MEFRTVLHSPLKTSQKMRFTIPLLMLGVLIFMIGAVKPKVFLIETDDMDVTEDEGTDYFGCSTCWDLIKPFKKDTRCLCIRGCTEACLFSGLGANNWGKGWLQDKTKHVSHGKK